MRLSVDLLINWISIDYLFEWKDLPMSESFQTKVCQPPPPRIYDFLVYYFGGVFVNSASLGLF
jgi:hypothetical protein